ncbi:MAG: acyl-CoA/acyl-ACP dehydrogenase [Deltaproteobacteria bacterium]|nr:acyl-CoA/acyl-ACP dehydrogenase [Deltaproteobacteria bacterium]
MANYLSDNDDLMFYLDKGIDWDPIVKLTERGFVDEDGPRDVAEAVETYRDIAQMVGQFSADEITPRVKAIEAAGFRIEDGEAVAAPEFDEIFDQLRELDLHRLNVPRELDGMNCPLMLYFIDVELMSRADVSVLAHHGFHGGMALAMLAFSIREGTTTFTDNRITETRFRDQMEEIASGQAWGCMDITEPDAGSDMASLRTVGRQDADGNWTTKITKTVYTNHQDTYASECKM